MCIRVPFLYQKRALYKRRLKVQHIRDLGGISMGGRFRNGRKKSRLPVEEIPVGIMKVFMLPHVTIIGLYRSPTISVDQFCRTLQQLLHQYSSEYCIFIGDFNCDWLNASNKTSSLYNLFIRDHSYRQLVTQYTTNYRTCLDHIYTNLPMSQVAPHVLETYFTATKQCVP